MADPYIPRKAGDFITAKDWNDVQSQVKDELRNHTHKGDNDGSILSGSALDRDSELTVKKMTTADARAVDLNVEKNLSVTGGLIMGFNPAFTASEADRDQMAVKTLSAQQPGTFLIFGPRKDSPESFCFYWKTNDEKRPYFRFDSIGLKGMGNILMALDGLGNKIK